MLKYYHRLIALKLLKKHTFSRVNKIPTHLTLREKIKLYELARHSPGNLVEVGSYLGASSCFLAMGISDNKSASKLFCVDTWQNDGMSEGKRDTYEEFLNNVKQFSDLIYALRGSSQKVAAQFDHRIRLLFIDADHSYDQCYQDWLLWKPYLLPGATVIFHDIGWAEGIRRVVEEQIEPLAKNEGHLPNMYWATL